MQPSPSVEPRPGYGPCAWCGKPGDSRYSSHPATDFDRICADCERPWHDVAVEMGRLDGEAKQAIAVMTLATTSDESALDAFRRLRAVNVERAQLPKLDAAWWLALRERRRATRGQ